MGFAMLEFLLIIDRKVTKNNIKAEKSKRGIQIKKEQ